MSTTIEHLHQDILEIKQELSLIKNILIEDFELTEEAIKELNEARRTAKEEYIPQDELKKKLLK